MSSAREATSPAHLSARQWLGVFRSTVLEVLNDNVPGLAAALTYYALLSLFPALIVGVALLALVGQSSTTDLLLDVLARLAPASAVDAVQPAIDNVVENKGTARTLLTFGILVSIWSASGYIGALMWASNVVYEVEQEGPFWVKLPRQLLLALGVLVALTAMGVVVVVSGPVAKAVGDVAGIGETTLLVYRVVRWPALFFGAILTFSVLDYFAPNVKHPRFRWITPGGVVGVVVWLLATVVFNFYVTSFGSYSATYGTLAGLIVFLLWLWILNVALLSSAEFNAELELARERAAGEEPGAAPRLPLRHVSGGEKRHGADPSFHKDAEKRPETSRGEPRPTPAARGGVQDAGRRRGAASLAADLLVLLAGLWALRRLDGRAQRRRRRAESDGR